MLAVEFYGCSTASKAYDKLEKLGEGTFGEVHKAKHRETGCVVALKKILLHNEKEGFPVTALREIKILKDLDHSNVIPLVDMSVERPTKAELQHQQQQQQIPRCSVYMVTPFMDHDLSGLLQNSDVRLSLPHIKCYMQQLLEGINYIHQQNYLHRDIKTANILIDNNGIVKLADFGLARKYFGKVPTKYGAGHGEHAYTSLVVTRWYRPPELVLGESKYTSAIDMWGIGCVFGEMFKRSPILQGESDIDQGIKIFKLVGSPTEDSMPGFSQLPGAREFPFGAHKPDLNEKTFNRMDNYGLSLLKGLLTLDPIKRLTALGALDHPFFKSDPLPAKPHELPKFPSSHEMTARKKKDYHNAPHAPNVNPSQHPQQSYNTSDAYSQPFAYDPSRYYHNNHHHHHHHRNNRHHHNPRHNYRGGGRNRNGPPPPPYRQQQQSRLPQPPYPTNNRHPNNGPSRRPLPPRPPYEDERPPYRRNPGNNNDNGLNYG